MASLDGLTAVVCGTSPNIGAGIAIGLAERGAAVGCVDKNARYARLCAEAVSSLGRKSAHVACDVTDEHNVALAFDSIGSQLGDIRILVNAAAFYNQKGTLSMPVAEWRRQLDVILTGAFICTKTVAQRMKRSGSGGAIINLISTAGHQGEFENVAYSTAKAGLLNFTRAAAVDLASAGIRVNSVTPTATDPREGIARARDWNVDASANDDAISLADRNSALLPLRALPRPSDYAAAVAFLCSSEACFITGADLKVDAGALAQYWRNVGTWDAIDAGLDDGIPRKLATP
jgi:NAD(P)-dependent dehydrogenase (short-subunit alcohol dehydrogenase family)